MGRRRLAYTIDKFEDGVYTRFLYDAESAVPKELERRIRLSDKVLRSLTVRLDEDWAVEAKLEAAREVVRRAEAAARAAEEAAIAAERAESAPAESAPAGLSFGEPEESDEGDDDDPGKED
jgi:small subunit ribosomal protein S6